VARCRERVTAIARPRPRQCSSLAKFAVAASLTSGQNSMPKHMPLI
jgi:hypothetical protein